VTRYVNAGVLDVDFVTTVANPLTPTVAELNAGVKLGSKLTNTGIDVPFEGSVVDGADMSSKFNATVAGTFGGQPGSAEFFREKEQASDLAYNTLPFGTSGYFAIARRGKAAGVGGAWAAGDRVDLIQIEVLARAPAPTARNETARFRCQFSIKRQPLEDYLLP